MKRPPIVLFVFKRPDHTHRTLEALARCQGAAESELFVYSDGPKNESDQEPVDAVRKLVRQAKGFRNVHVTESAKNQGLAHSVISGVGRVLETQGACVVVEDDLDFSPLFLDFMGTALDLYRDDPRVFSISGYAPPHDRVPVPSADSVWFAPRPCSWGWAIWKDRWDKVDWSVTDRELFRKNGPARQKFNQGGRDLSYFLRLQLQGDLDSWAVRLAWSQSRHDGLTLYPSRSFVLNCGLDGTGTHSLAQKGQEITLADAVLPRQWPKVAPSPESLLRQFRRHYEGTWMERWGHRGNKIVRQLKKLFR